MTEQTELHPNWITQSLSNADMLLMYTYPLGSCKNHLTQITRVPGCTAILAAHTYAGFISGLGSRGGKYKCRGEGAIPYKNIGKAVCRGGALPGP